jgi:hypothetical protein
MRISAALSSSIASFQSTTRASNHVREHYAGDVGRVDKN